MMPNPYLMAVARERHLALDARLSAADALADAAMELVLHCSGVRDVDRACVDKLLEVVGIYRGSSALYGVVTGLGHGSKL